MDVIEQIRKLVEVQKIDSQIYSKKAVVEKEKPQQLQALEEELLGKRSGLTAAEEALKAIQLKNKELEIEDLAKHDALNKAEGDLINLKSNVEYQTKLKEIAKLKSDISGVEDGEIEAMEEVSECESKLAEAKKAFAYEEKTYSEKRISIEKEIEILKDEIALLQAKKDAAINGLDKILLARYQRVVEAKNGLAIVPYANDACGGCHMNLPMDMFNKIKTSLEVQSCPMCARMLYLEDEL